MDEETDKYVSGTLLGRLCFFCGWFSVFGNCSVFLSGVDLKNQESSSKILSQYGGDSIRQQRTRQI